MRNYFRSFSYFKYAWKSSSARASWIETILRINFSIATRFPRNVGICLSFNLSIFQSFNPSIFQSNFSPTSSQKRVNWSPWRRKFDTKSFSSEHEREPNYSDVKKMLLEIVVVDVIGVVGVVDVVGGSVVVGVGAVVFGVVAVVVVVMGSRIFN